MTGPNDSSFAIIMWSSTSVKTVGAKKRPETQATNAAHSQCTDAREHKNSPYLEGKHHFSFSFPDHIDEYCTSMEL